jgi:hypothetical protein
MPRQNRVTPFGEIIATPERGTFMGNRGALHDHEGRIKRTWQVKRWLICVLEFRGRKRTVMTPNRYTELFFLDEATALAAGHRPCAECRHRRYRAFRDAWKLVNSSNDASHRPTASEMDDCLHAERVNSDRSKNTFSSALDQLPDGVLVTFEGQPAQAYLVLGDSLLAWSWQGYQRRRPRPNNERVIVLTPKSTVEVIRAGYVPEVHASARQRIAGLRNADF